MKSLTSSSTQRASEKLEKLRAELHELYKLSERTGSTVRKMEEIIGKIREIQEGKQ